MAYKTAYKVEMRWNSTRNDWHDVSEIRPEHVAELNMRYGWQKYRITVK